VYAEVGPKMHVPIQNISFFLQRSPSKPHNYHHQISFPILSCFAQGKDCEQEAQWIQFAFNLMLPEFDMLYLKVPIIACEDCSSD
jgi:hypothetical protein